MVYDRISTISDRAVGSGGLFVIDGLFDEGQISFYFESFRRLKFVRNETASEETQAHKSLNCNLDLEFLRKNPVFKYFIDTIIDQSRMLFPEKEWVLDRVHCNCQFSDDLQYIHHDIPGGLTALYFVNDRWPGDWMGETLFYDAEREATHAVSFKPGRLLVFDADMLHRGGLPSPDCSDPRLSVAFKFYAGGT